MRYIRSVGRNALCTRNETVKARTMLLMVEKPKREEFCKLCMAMFGDQ